MSDLSSKPTMLLPFETAEDLKAALVQVEQAFAGQAIHLVALFEDSLFEEGDFGAVFVPGSFARQIVASLKDIYAEINAAAQRVLTEHVFAIGSSHELRSRVAVSARPAGRDALYADYVVLVGKSAAGAGPREELIARFLDSGDTPILLLPASGRLTALFARPMLAWKETPEAARALRWLAAALPSGSALNLVSLQERDDPLQTQTMGEPSALAAAQYLSRHGLKVTEQILQHTAHPVASDLDSHAKAEKASLLVIGAFSQRRWRERLFGGVTSQLVRDYGAPLLLI